MTKSPFRTWLITGCSAGFGRVLAEAALARGDRVMLTARDPGKLADLAARYPETARTAKLDVTHAGDAAAAVAATQAAFGALDVLVNNAGYGFLGAVEEAAPEEYRALFDANVFGLIEMTRAALPLMRQGTGGRIVQFSSNLGLQSRAGYGYYSATKFAVEGLSEALAAELEPLGICVILVEPGAFRTDFLGRSIAFAADRIDAYEATVGAVRTAVPTRAGAQPGDPRRGVAVILQAVDAQKPPLRLALGPDAHRNIRAKLARVATDLDAWEHVAADTDFRE
ncbi:oxidoreductase [Roseixanthobacter liquoris]|uniref:oxidoreductase n=1 Tax=Roseixanthobacter liquoris TaxID=3119921 RepID=UPI00372A55F8